MTTTTAVQQPDTELARHIPLGLLAPSPTNPRKRFDPAKLGELAESIKKFGVMQPILARPNPAHNDGNGQPPFEIVAGERRWRASKLAERTSVLTLVRDLSDVEALQLQFLENIEREDLHPMEEADGLHSLMQTAKLAVEDIAAKIGKSLRWVFLRLSLRNLCPKAREAFMAGEINASVAGLIARMPSQDQQAKATERILTGFGGEPFTYRAAADYLRKEFMLDLANAPFNIDSTYDAAGPCHRCDKRSGSKPDLFDDVKTGDLCQDSICFNAKAEEAHERLLQACRDAGHQVLQGDAAKRLMPTLAAPSGYFRADQSCPSLTADKRTLFDVFGDKQKGFITVEHAGTRTLVTLVPEPVARKALAAKKLLRAVEAKPAVEPAAAAAPAAAAPQPAAATAPTPAAPAPKPAPMTSTQMQHAIEGRAGQLFSRQLFMQLCSMLREAEEPPLIILRCKVADDLIGASAEGIELVRQAFPDMPQDSSRDFGRQVRLWVAGLSSRDLANALAIVAIAEELSNEDRLDTLDDYSSFAAPLADAFGLDLEAMDQALFEQATQEVHDEEDRRLGKISAGDAFAAAQAETADA